MTKKNESVDSSYFQILDCLSSILLILSLIYLQSRVGNSFVASHRFQKVSQWHSLGGAIFLSGICKCAPPQVYSLHLQMVLSAVFMVFSFLQVSNRRKCLITSFQNTSNAVFSHEVLKNRLSYSNVDGQLSKNKYP